MKNPDGATHSSWYDGVEIPQYAHPPQGETRADVCIVGAGIAGMTAAYLLLCQGKSVIVLDEGPVGSGQTGRTGAHLASAIDDRFIEIERIHGEQGSRMAHQSHAAAIDAIERISRDERIDCDLARLNAYLFSVPEDAPDLLDRELAAARRAGFSDCEKLERVELCGHETGPCIRFWNQARFHPVKYLSGLAQAIERLGGKIYTGCRVKDVQGADPKTHQPARAQIDGGPAAVLADHIVVATNTPAPLNDWMGIYTKQASYRTYMIGAAVPRRSVDDALYWDTGDPYHYVRLQHGHGADGEDLLLVGGEDHKTGQFQSGAAPFMRLETWARENFPMIRDVRHRWSGQVQEPADFVAYIGRAPTAGKRCTSSPATAAWA